MPLTGKSSDEITELENKFISQIPADHAIGNKTLRDNLGWDLDLYLAIKQRLLSDGIITLGRGKGGSVRRVFEEQYAEDIEKEFEEDPYQDEDSLYEPMLEVIQQRWIKDQPFDQVLAERTDRGGRRKDGVWTRPDITVASMTSYTYVPGRFFDVITFEIKHYSGLNVTCVYEALAHRRAATRSYVIAYIPDNRYESLEDTLGDVNDEAKKHGVGFIVAGDPADYDTWEIWEESIREQPDPARLNEFIRAQLQEGSRDQIVRWFRV